MGKRREERGERRKGLQSASGLMQSCNLIAPIDYSNGQQHVILGRELKFNLSRLPFQRLSIGMAYCYCYCFCFCCCCWRKTKQVIEIVIDKNIIIIITSLSLDLSLELVIQQSTLILAAFKIAAWTSTNYGLRDEHHHRHNHLASWWARVRLKARHLEGVKKISDHGVCGTNNYNIDTVDHYFWE